MSEAAQAGNALHRPWVKICGATRPADIDLLAGAGVDLVGLWHGVPGGHAELGTGRLAALTQAAATTRLRPVLITLQATAAAVRQVMSAAGLSWVQLHGYQPPGTIELLGEVTALTDAPVLQKDFLTRGSQLRQARELGASAVLLTAKLLPAAVLGHLIEHAPRIGLTPFVDVCGEEEIDAVIHGPDCVVAVNNKDIRDRERDRGDIERSMQLLAAVAGSGTPCSVSASGIHRPEAAAHLVNSGYAGLLIGTALMRASSPQAWFAEFERHRNTSLGLEIP